MAGTLNHTPSDAGLEAAVRFSVSARTADSRIRLRGELDAETACLLGSTVQGQIARHHVDLSIDVADLAFIDLAGFYALGDARRRVGEHGGQLTVVGYDPFFAQVAAFCDLHDVLDGSRRPSQEAARPHRSQGG